MSRPIALITGASAGIGQELARVFAARGYDLIICARREERLQTLADELSGVAKVHTVAVDLSKAKGPAKLVGAIEELDLPVDVLINNAGCAFQFGSDCVRKSSVMIPAPLSASTEMSASV